jgi:hypothetical protein
MPVKEFTGQLDKPKAREFTGELDQSQGPAAQQPPSVLSQLGRGLALSGRAVAEGVAGLPMMAMDAGVATRNLGAMLLRGQLPNFADFNPFASEGGSRMDYELPSSMMRRSINALGVPEPSGFAEKALSFGTSVVSGAKIPGPQAAQQAPPGFKPTSDFELDQALKFAREQDAPFPLSSAAPGSAGSRAQQATRGLLAGELRTQADAKNVTQFLNRQVSTIVDDAKPIDAAALKGQQFLKEVFEPGELAYRKAFGNFKEVAGAQTAIPLTSTAQVLKQEAQALAQRGSTSPAIQQIQKLAKNTPGEMTAQQLDDVYKELSIKLSKNGAGYNEVQRVLGAIVKDMDEVGKSFGLSFADDAARAGQMRQSWHALRSIPGLERLAKDFGAKGGTLGTRQWMAELFGNPNGKALAELRKQNPALYHELADSWLANNINRFSKPVKDGIGKALDGTEFRAWFEQSADNLKVIFGAERAKALDNFSIYAKHMTGAVQRYVSPGRLSDPVALAGRAVAEYKAAAANPVLMVPGEAAAYWIAKSLSDPNSGLFKLFSKGMSPATRSFIIKSSAMTAPQTEKFRRNGEDSR